MLSKTLILLACMAIQRTLAEMSVDEYQFRYFSRIHQEVCQPIGECLEQQTTPEGGVEISRVPKQCCGECSCKPDCFTLGNCCLKMYDSFEHGIRIVSKSRYECVKLQFLNDTMSKSKFFSKRKYWIVTKCPVDASTIDANDRKLCEHPGLNGDLETLQPVSDLSGTTHFVNKYCAFCNGRYDIETRAKWKLEVHCGEIISLTDENLFGTLVSKQCNILYKPPSTAVLKECQYWQKYNISTCNETGKWDIYDKFLDLACNAFVDPLNETYKNYFCMLCNTRARQSTGSDICYIDHENIVSVSPPFFAILDIDLWKEQKGETPRLRCGTSSQFSDNKLMRCRDILCDQSRYLIYDATCGMLDNLTSDYLCFDLFIKMTPTGNISIVPQTIDKYMLYKVIPQSRHIQLLFPESSPVSTIFNYFLVHIIRYGDEWFVMKIEKLHNSKVKMNVSGILTEFYVEIGLFEVSENALYDEVFVTNQENTSKVDVFRTTKLEVTPYSKSVCPPKRSYTFDRLLYCPFIKLGFDELTVTMENGFLSFWRKSLILITLLKWQYRLTGEGFLICLEDYLLINNALPDAVTFDGPENESVSGQVGPKRMLSFICVCLSLVCLFITITVYVRFSELRSQPGVNNLILCSCLLCAQAVYQFAAGQQNHSQAACAVVGAICHFLWLTVMFALNSCSLQMFMIFRSHARLLSSYNTRTTVVTILYVVGSSLLFVVVNIVVSLTRSSGGDIGYGGNVCFITACDMHIITFIIPSFILIIVNFLLFVIVLYKMREFNIVSSRLNQERSYLRINARLSTLTGLTWLFGFIQILVRNDVLEYLFIILNASQGLFIMVAFICNQRVYSLIFKTSTRTSLDVAVVTKQSSIPN